MSYQQRTEYHREVRDEDQNKSGGWKSWFGLGDNKDRDVEDREYNYKATTSYRNPEHPSYGYTGARSTYPERTGYSGPVGTGYTGARGGYGYTTSDEVTRGPSWNTDRDYNTRPSYGQPTTTGDRDVYYKQETRTYGGDREYRPTTTGDYRPTTTGDYRPTTTGDYTSRSYTPSRGYGFSGDYYTGRGDYTGRDYIPSREYTTSRYQTDRDYAGRGYGGDRDYSYSRTCTTGGDRDYGYSTGGRTTTGYPYATGGYGNPPYTTSYGGPEPTYRGYGGYGESRGYSTGYTGGETSTYTRPSYQPSSYRY